LSEAAGANATKDESKDPENASLGNVASRSSAETVSSLIDGKQVGGEKNFRENALKRHGEGEFLGILRLELPGLRPQSRGAQDDK